ncbi:MAG: RagB/SusD family nutrient uptake outer membrane protein [Cyclobacteriaceae bacterium]
MRCVILILLIITSSCESVLDQEPKDRYSEQLVWNDLNLADNYLKGCYHDLNLLNGWNSLINLDAVSDDIYFIHIFGTDLYLEGNLTATSQGPFGNNFLNHINWGLYDNIHSLNSFLTNIDNLLIYQNGNEEIVEKIEIMKGEALLLRAICYAKLALTYGGLPILTEPLELGDDYLTIKRSTFEETIEFISNECDLASQKLLSKNQMESGRVTKGTALALKSRVLLFAASDLTADGSVNNSLIGYINPDRKLLWESARDAAKAVIDLGLYSLEDFGGPEEVADNYYNFFKQKDLSSSEIIWGKLFNQSVGDSRLTNLHNGPNGNSNWGSNNPTQDLVDVFQMADGSNFFEHFQIDANGYYVNISEKYESINPYDNREPRFYASILYDGAKWQTRFSNLQDRDPVGTYDRRTRITMENGKETQIIPGIDTRQGPVTPEDGGYTGYLMKKHLDDEIVGRDEKNYNSWVEFRYAEVILNYAEALIELGETSEASIYINMIRNRSGLPNFKEGIKEALRKERRIELVFEHLRWYDIRRWKLLQSNLTNAKGMVITETINKDDGSVNTTWKQIDVQRRDVNDEKFYWIPISFDEISRAPQLEQNPGY